MKLHARLGRGVGSKTPMTVWRRIEVVGLLATIPAFYMALQAGFHAASFALYAAACTTSIAVLWNESRRDRLGQLLSFALLLSAVLPAGETFGVLMIRLGTAVLVILRMGDSIRPWFWRGELPRLLPLAIAVLGLCGLGFWWLEPQALTYGDGLWLAFTTAATVGYGDIVPSTPASKIFAVFVVLMGFAMISLVTAAIAAMWVQTEERRIEGEILDDLHRELREIRSELAALRARREIDTGPDDERRQTTRAPRE